MLINKTLKTLLVDITEVRPELDREISGLTTDSREVQPGHLFIAYPGLEQDGRDYIADAIKKGASAVVCEAQGFAENNNAVVPVIAVANLQRRVGEIAARFYDYPSRKMTIVGITGTNGKTSCTQFLAQALEANQVKCGVIGTLGVGFPTKLSYGVYTTPDPIALQKELYAMQQQDTQVVAMEVSSHGLEQGRVTGVEFNIAVFTNLSQDHLDYHGDMFSYGEAKKLLFHRPELEHAVINIDDEFGRKLIDEIAADVDVIGYSIEESPLNQPQMVKAHDIQQNAKGFVAEITTLWGDGILKSKLLGRFNVSNLLAVLAVLGLMKISVPQALTSLGQLGTVPGRMQIFGGGIHPLVVVDFSHTPVALEQALKALRAHCSGVLWCVFGCGGDRDRGKRPIMGQIAEHHSDRIIITDDNPRTEDPQSIVNDILQGLLCPWAAEIERDRGAAIAHAIDCAKAGDIILVAGKGHEPYQTIGTEKIPFSDIEQVTSLLA